MPHEEHVVEISLDSVEVKHRVTAVLRDDGCRVESGPVRVAYPFTLLVLAPSAPALERAIARILQTDPGAAILLDPVPGTPSQPDPR